MPQFRALSLRARAGLLGALILLAGCAAEGGDGAVGTTGPASVGAPVPSVAPSTVPVAEPGTYTVRTIETVLVDPDRTTAANRTAPELPTRTLPLVVHHPAGGDGGRYPLIVFSHGVGGNAGAYRATLEDIAGAGYVVAAPDYPLSSSGSPGGAVVTDVAEQTRDIAFLVEQLLAGPGDLAPVVDLIDDERLGIAGHSLGGITTLGAAYSECCAVRGVDAAVAWAGLLFGLEREDPVDPERDGPPLLLVHGDADNIVGYDNAATVLSTVRAPRSLVTILGGDHIAPYLAGVDQPSSEVTTRVTLAFFDHHLKGDRKGLDRIERVVADSEGVATLQDGQLE